MKKTLYGLCAMLFLLFTSKENVYAYSSAQSALPNNSSQQNSGSFQSKASKTATFVSDFLSVLEEGLIQPSTGIVHSSSQLVRTITFSSANSFSEIKFKINRQTAFQYLKSPLALVKQTPCRFLLLRVLLI